MVIQVLNSKLGITLRVSVTSETKIHKHGFDHNIMTYNKSE